MTNFLVYEFNSLPSTHTFSKENIKLYSGDTLIIAKQQTSGIGRRGGEWISPLGNFYGSFILKSADFIDEKNLSHLSFIVAVGVAIYFKSFDFNDFSFKWPNDIFNIEMTHKIGGILIEKIDSSYILSIGINLVSVPSESLSSASYSFLSLSDLNADTLLENWSNQNLFQNILNLLDSYKEQGFEDIQKRWMQKCGHINQFITLSNGLSGVFKGIDHTGAPIF
ncbi:MAG: biotin--[acetyl-CoA-carboxylase] ligase [Proteobacteria bacterium]|nr:biotin--[acetyl-CoA-carboxylase] ligase [Pseudomonadota bacterium]